MNEVGQQKSERFQTLKDSIENVEQRFWMAPCLIVAGFLGSPEFVTLWHAALFAGVGWAGTRMWIRRVLSDPDTAVESAVAYIMVPIWMYVVIGTEGLPLPDRIARIAATMGAAFAVWKLVVQSRKTELHRRIAEAEKRIEPRGVLGMDSG